MTTNSVSLPGGKVAAIAGVVVLGLWIGPRLWNRPEPVDSGSINTSDHQVVRTPGRMVHSLAHGLGGGRMDDQVLERLDNLERMALVDPIQALAQLDSFTDSDMRGLALAAIGRGWGDEDPQAAARWIEGLESDDDQVSAALGLIPVWAEQEPESAFGWSLTRAEGSTLRELSLVEVADVWGDSLPQRAMEEFLALPAESGTERGLHVISTQWALDHPDQAIRFFSALDPAGRRDEFLEAALVSLTNEHPELSWREASRVSDAGRVAHIQSQALEAIAESRPQDALRLAATGGDLRLNCLGIARGWSYLNPAQAQVWAEGLEDQELRLAAIAEIRKYAGDFQKSDKEK